MKKFWNWIDKRRYKSFDRYLDQAERWRHKRAEKDKKNYPHGLAPDYDDRLQKQYLNFQTNQFQLIFTILTIVGMLISGVLGGYFVYSLTKNSPAEVFIGRIGYDATTNTGNFSISGFGKNPAVNLIINYDIPELDDVISFNAKTIPILHNREETFSISFDSLEHAILSDLKKEMENSFVEISKGEYLIRIKVSCRDCNTTIFWGIGLLLVSCFVFTCFSLACFLCLVTRNQTDYQG